MRDDATQVCPDYPHCSHVARHGCGLTPQPGTGMTGGHFVIECPRPRCVTNAVEEAADRPCRFWWRQAVV
jgi:hypothetical protein